MRFIFVQIRGGKVVTYASVENSHYRQRWGAELAKLAPPSALYKAGIQQAKDSYSCRSHQKVDTRTGLWTATDCFFNPWEWHGSVGNAHYTDEYLEMLEEATRTYRISDVDLILNKKDSHFVRADGKLPYSVQRIGPGRAPERLYPIVSVSTREGYLDIALPTVDDWNLVKSRSAFRARPEWSTRKPMAVFRGAATGCGHDARTNQRIKVASLRKEGVLDAALTRENCRLRLSESDTVTWTALRKDRIPFTRTLMPRSEQEAFKYIVHIDGNVAAYRLAEDLASGSTVLKVDSRGGYKVWFSDLLKPWVHYVPVHEDAGNLYDAIEWCRQNDEKARTIAANASRFVREHITLERLLQYYQWVLNSLAVRR
jgi:hypothetical protein